MSTLKELQHLLSTKFTGSKLILPHHGNHSGLTTM
jgi:hypothetical protein